MESHKNDIGPIIKNQLKNLKERPDDFVWTNIEMQLKRKRKRKRFLAFWIFGVFLSSILLATLIFNMSSDSNLQDHKPPSPIIIKKDNSNDIIGTKDSILNNTITERNNNQESHSLFDLQKINRQREKSAETSEYNRSQGSNPHNRLQLGGKNKKKGLLSGKKSSSTEKSDINKPINTLQILENLETIDTIPNTNPLPKALELPKNESRKEELKDSTIDQKLNKWSIIPQGSLSYFGNFSSKSSDNLSTNYGILIAYTTNDKTFLRFGLRQLRLSQTTNDQFIEFEYLEFPLDIKYAPLDKKINPYVIGGLSYILLQESMNSALTDLDHSSSSFSMNLGLGAEYKLFKDIYINVEPYFNYQIKPITNNDNISPFIFSIYSGIEFRF